MAPVSSAFAIYQEKRRRGQKKMNKRKRKLKPQVKHWPKDVLIMSSNEDTAFDNHTGLNEKEPMSSNGVIDTPREEQLRIPAKRKNPSPLMQSKSGQRQELLVASKKNKTIKQVQTKKNPNPEMKIRFQVDDDPSESEEELEYLSQEDDSVITEQDPNVIDSIKEGEQLFAWMINPCTNASFFTNAWEQKPVHIKRRNDPNYYQDLISVEQINLALRKHHIVYGKHIDITQYSNGKRKTLNPGGRATNKEVWDFYNAGCSIRLLNPQAFISGIAIVLSSLQEYFCSFVGANVYLTPPNSQGFAPHYDDIEAFVLQVDGKKHWKIYKPRKGEELPRESSKDFQPSDLNETPDLELTLNPGELLYFPRGWIHQAHTVPGFKSLHVTVSCYQHQSWIDLFEKLMPAALTSASTELEFRRGLPLGYLHNMGVAHCDLNTSGRKAFMSHFMQLTKKFVKLFQVDAAIDQFGRQFMHDSLPPLLGTVERKQSIFSHKNLIETIDGKLVIERKLTKEMRVKISRASVLRIVSEDNSNNMVQVYYSAKNSLVYHESEEHRLEVDIRDAYILEYLLHIYPQYSKISELPSDMSVPHKVRLATQLFNHGILLVTI